MRGTPNVVSTWRLRDSGNLVAVPGAGDFRPRLGVRLSSPGSGLSSFAKHVSGRGGKDFQRCAIPHYGPLCEPAAVAILRKILSRELSGKRDQNCALTRAPYSACQASCACPPPAWT